MSKTAAPNILDVAQLALRIFCEKSNCDRKDSVHNTIILPISGEDAYFEAFGHGSEDAETDNCPSCDELGTLADPIRAFLFPIEGEENLYIAVNMPTDMIDSLIGLLNQQKEERMRAAPLIFDDQRAGFGFSQSFHVFDGTDFENAEFDLNKHSYPEQAHCLQCAQSGICFSCEVKFKGEGKVVATPWLTSEDLLALRSWLAARA